MTHSLLPPPKITRNSLCNTIETDQQVFRWFLYLLEHQQVRAEFADHAEMNIAYRNMMVWRWTQRGVLAAVLAIMGAVILTQVYTWIWALLLLAVVLFFVEKPLKDELYRISQFVIDRHYDEKTFPQHTLYQIGEHLARHYKITSLVEGITLTDNLMRKSLVIIAFLVVFLFVMSFLRGLAMLFLLFYAGNIFVNSSLVYRHYMK